MDQLQILLMDYHYRRSINAEKCSRVPPKQASHLEGNLALFGRLQDLEMFEDISQVYALTP